MAKLRPAKCYREIEKAYTRKSKYKKKGFIKGIPGSKIVLFDMGQKGRYFGATVSLVAKEPRQIRHNSLESARMAAVRRLNKNVGNNSYYLKIRAYPHQILRENPIAAGAGADRFSTGMTKAFGKVISTAARVKPGQKVLSASVPIEKITGAKEAMRKAADKIGCKFEIDVEIEVGKPKIALMKIRSKKIDEPKVEAPVVEEKVKKDDKKVAKTRRK